ncbi:MAG: hypothetical protein IT372_21635 [Polyangiaceae bacterium]|nr:hypothetical protein [Polyangiaceae bacterium]
MATSPGSSPSAQELPPPILLGCSGLVAITIIVMGAIGLRALTSRSSSDLDRPPAAAAPSAAPPSSAPAIDAGDGAPDAPPPSARELRARLDKDLQTGRFGAFISGLDELLRIDPSAAQDRDIRNAIVDVVLMRIMVGGGDQPERLFAILTEKMGTTGIDILYELVTTRGSSRASKRAGELLKDEAVRARGTPAMRIAYDLRMADCASKPALFERAKEDGDGRTLGQLQELNRQCGRRGGPCCMYNNPALRAAIDGLKARLGSP